MSTVPAPVPQPQVGAHIPAAEREIRVYSHSALFYWWPVWAVGFLMALLTYFEHDIMTVVPRGTQAIHDAQIISPDHERDQPMRRDALVLPEKNGFHPGDEAVPHLYMTRNKNLGVLYAVVLLVIILVSNVSLRGLWSVIIILFIVLFVVTMILAGWWAIIVDKFRLIDIRINLGGYAFISLVLFIIWAFTFFVFDHRTYLIISSGQVRVCMAVGAGETVYDTTGMTFQKRQDDLFRHWIVGLGSGDLIMHKSNTSQEVDFSNVMFIGAKIREIEKLMKEREVV